MAGADKLIEKINADAQRDAEKYWQDAEDKKRDMRARLTREIDKRKAEIEKMAVQAGAEKKKRMAAVYDLEYRKQLLFAKQEMMDKAKEVALQKLLALGDDEYVDLMRRKLIACAQTGEGGITIAKDEKRLGKAFLTDVNKTLKKSIGTGNIKLLSEKRNILGGFVYVEGGMEINLSLESQLNEAWQEIETDVAAVLFE